MAVAHAHLIEIACLNLGPERALGLAVTELVEDATAAAIVAVGSASRLLVAAEDVVLAVLDRFGAQDAVDIVPMRELIGPLADRVKHGALNLDAVSADSRMMECA